MSHRRTRINWSWMYLHCNLRKLKDPQDTRDISALQTPLCRQTQSSRTFILTEEFHLIEPLMKLLCQFVWRKRNGPRISFCSPGTRHSAPFCQLKRKQRIHSLYFSKGIFTYSITGSKYSANSRLSTSEYSAGGRSISVKDCLKDCLVCNEVIIFKIFYIFKENIEIVSQ